MLKLQTTETRLCWHNYLRELTDWIVLFEYAYFGVRHACSQCARVSRIQNRHKLSPCPGACICRYGAWMHACSAVLLLTYEFRYSLDRQQP